MEILSLDHVQLAMPPGGEAQARAFYATVLGLVEVPKPTHLAMRGGCWFERGTARIHLGVDKDFRPARKAHPALLVDDLRALAVTLNAAGFATRDGEPLEGYVRIDVNDPFGNRVELMQRTGSAG
jgi:catechol 2,3-dioxygenase-like lactoylglutathione lyase family enzyme